MYKVIFSIRRHKKNAERVSGIGMLDNENLYIPSSNSKGKLFIQVFENIKDSCKKVANTENEFKGEYEQVFKNQAEDIISIYYDVWFKILDN